MNAPRTRIPDFCWARCSLSLAALTLITALAAASEPAPCESSNSSNPLVQEITSQQPNSNVESFAAAVKKVAPAVVRVIVSLPPGNADAQAAPDAQRHLYLPEQLGFVRRPAAECALGSGVIVTEDGYILTNGHVVEQATEVQVTLLDGREFKAQVIGVDARSDIAVVRIDARGLPAVPLADSRNVQVGDLALAFGYPFGVGQTVTHGIISATDRGIGLYDYERFIQTDAPINPGNSGGPLVDATGRLIGINSSILSRSGGNMGIGFAVPSELARKVMADLVKYGFVVRGYLGIESQDLTPELAKEFELRNVTGSLLTGVASGGPADKAGLRVGDVITRFDGQQVRDTRQLMFSVAEARPYQTISIETMRNGSPLPLQVVLGCQSTGEPLTAPPQPAEPQVPAALQGVTVIELSGQVRHYLKIPTEVRGAAVLDLHAWSAAAQAGLRPGDIIESVDRHDVSTTEEVSRLIQTSKPEATLLRVWSSAGGSHFILVRQTRP